LGVNIGRENGGRSSEQKGGRGEAGRDEEGAEVAKNRMIRGV